MSFENPTFESRESAAKEKLVMPEADPPLAENCQRGGAANCAGFSPPPQAAK